jgi:hypothetical protein
VHNALSAELARGTVPPATRAKFPATIADLVACGAEVNRTATRSGGRSPRGEHDHDGNRRCHGSRTASAADTLPAYRFTQTLNLGIKGETCHGFYRVTRATHKFTEHNLHVCPRMGSGSHRRRAQVIMPTCNGRMAACAVC